MTRNKAPPPQFSMIAAFVQADFERATADLPDTIDAAGPYLRGLIERYHGAIIAGDQGDADKARQDADVLARRLNGNTSFGVKERGGVCDQLEALIAAPDGEIPLWGQPGTFTIDIRGCRIRIEFDGIYGLCELGFSAHAIDWDKPFISETGYQSFLSLRIDCTGGGMPVEDAVRAIIENQVERELKGKLFAIDQRYREGQKQEEPQP